MMRGMGNMPLWDNLLTFQICLTTIRSCRMWNFLWDNFPRHHLVGRSSEAKAKFGGDSRRHIIWEETDEK